MPCSEAQQTILALESEGFVLRGKFRPHASEEFCERRLLARIHRLTLNRLRREIEPVSPSQFIDFLTHHQSLQSSSRREGNAGTLAIIEQLAGFPIAAGSWETQVLGARIRDYRPTHLDQLCLSGEVMWAAKRRVIEEARSSQGPIKSTPIVLLPRDEMTVWHHPPAISGLGADAQRLADILSTAGALFFDDLKRRAGLLPSQAEKALAELVTNGLVNTDSFAGLRALLTPEKQRREVRKRPSGRGKHSAAARHGTAAHLSSAGRISWLSPEPGSADSGTEIVSEFDVLVLEDRKLESIAWTLLARWGVVFRRILEREVGLPAWSQLLRVYHRLEARGEIRGGRFVTGFSGEQFATSEAITLLRQVRKQGPSKAQFRLAATDPMNLIGIVTPGAKLPATPRNQLLLQGGEFLGVLEAGEVKSLISEADATFGAPPTSLREIREAFRAGTQNIRQLVPIGTGTS
jgi:ATP-dependent helicase Lhr and Lhr-like helicase